MQADSQRELEKRWVENWKELGPILARKRREEIRLADNLNDIRLLDRAFSLALAQPLRTTSGLIEMQRYFAKLRP